MKSAGLWQRLAVFAGLSVLVLALVATIMGFSPHDPGGALSTDPEGRRAALELLQRNGHRVVSWQQAPGNLAEVDAVLLVGEDVFESDAAAGERSARDPRSGEHYRSFMEAGGRAVVDVYASSWLTDQVGLDISDEEHPRPKRTAPLTSPAGEAFDVDLSSALPLPRRVDGQPGTVLLEGGERQPFAALYPVGDGALLLVGDTDLWRNESIADADHAYLLLALVGMVGGDRTVLFDEFARGIHSPPGFISMTFSGRVAPFGWTLLLWMTLSVLSTIWIWRFPRDPRPADTVHPFLRVQAGARLFERARRPRDVANKLRAGVMRRLARRLNRTRLESDEARQLENALDRAPDAATRDRWQSALVGELPQGRRSLESWAAELIDIERAVEASLRRETHGMTGRDPRTKHG